ISAFIKGRDGYKDGLSHVGRIGNEEVISINELVGVVDGGKRGVVAADGGWETIDGVGISDEKLDADLIDGIIPVEGVAPLVGDAEAFILGENVLGALAVNESGRVTQLGVARAAGAGKIRAGRLPVLISCSKLRESAGSVSSLKSPLRTPGPTRTVCALARAEVAKRRAARVRFLVVMRSARLLLNVERGEFVQRLLIICW
ncbi:hypothetical protein N9A89_03695, partial [Akkermansiaceae bacterium]|nr:hypothetical protein [Akkermansiaceae bacterium]